MAHGNVALVHTNPPLAARSPPGDTVRVKLSLSSEILQAFDLKKFWKFFWFVVPPDAILIADVLPLVWASMQLTEQPIVQLFCDGCYIPTQSYASVLREGDVIDVALQEEASPPQHAQLGALSRHHSSVQTPITQD